MRWNCQAIIAASVDVPPELGTVRNCRRDFLDRLCRRVEHRNPFPLQQVLALTNKSVTRWLISGAELEPFANSKAMAGTPCNRFCVQRRGSPRVILDSSPWPVTKAKAQTTPFLPPPNPENHLGPSTVLPTSSLLTEPLRTIAVKIRGTPPLCRSCCGKDVLTRR